MWDITYLTRAVELSDPSFLQNRRRKTFKISGYPMWPGGCRQGQHSFSFSLRENGTLSTLRSISIGKTAVGGRQNHRSSLLFSFGTEFLKNLLKSKYKWISDAFISSFQLTPLAPQSRRRRRIFLQKTFRQQCWRSLSIINFKSFMITIKKMAFNRTTGRSVNL